MKGNPIVRKDGIRGIPLQIVANGYYVHTMFPKNLYKLVELFLSLFVDLSVLEMRVLLEVVVDGSLLVHPKVHGAHH
jgi:hypothetical protein